MVKRPSLEALLYPEVPHGLNVWQKGQLLGSETAV